MYNYSGVSDKGNKLEINEDYFQGFIVKNVMFLLIADGFGSKEGYNYSSAIAANEIKRYIEMSLEGDKVDQLKKVISEATYIANRVLLSYKAADNKTFSGFGTSLTLCCITQNKDVIVYHTGNTRLYIVRSGTIAQFTKDYTEAQALFEQGKISLEELRLHPDRKLLTGALGFEPYKFEITQGRLQTNDILLLCSDGIYEMLSENEVIRIVTEASNLKIASDWLKEGALRRGGIDNLSAIISIIKH